MSGTRWVEYDKHKVKKVFDRENKTNKIPKKNMYTEKSIIYKQF